MTQNTQAFPDNAPMPTPRHLLLPFAAASAPECQAILPRLQLPRLSGLLSRLVELPADRGDAHTLSPPHERALARAIGLPSCRDGQTPWAAARSPVPTLPQAWFSPCHFQVGMGMVQLLPIPESDLPEDEGRALMDSLAPFCAQDGIRLQYDSPTLWHACGEALRGLACASLDRVSGRQVDAWMTESPDNPAGALLLKRLQSEAQMLFYAHPVHDARTARGRLPVNGFWVHGAGALDIEPTPTRPPDMPDTLRQAALRADWPAWQAAWTALDEGVIADLLAAAQRGEPVTLTLCGERHARTWVSSARSAWARLTRPLTNLLGQSPARLILEDL